MEQVHAKVRVSLLVVDGAPGGPEWLCGVCASAGVCAPGRAVGWLVDVALGVVGHGRTPVTIATRSRAVISTHCSAGSVTPRRLATTTPATASSLPRSMSA